MSEATNAEENLMTAVSTESRPRVRAARAVRIEGKPRLALPLQTGLAQRVTRGLLIESELGEQETDDCGCSGRCVECDPDTYRDLEAELLAGRRDW